MISKAEVIRRVRELVRTPAKERLIPIERLAQVAGIHDETIYGIAASGSMAEISYRRLARALAWVENDQLEIRRRPNKPTRVSIRAPQPPQENTMRVQVDGRGPRVEFHAVNPRTFPRRKT